MHQLPPLSATMPWPARVHRSASTLAAVDGRLVSGPSDAGTGAVFADETRSAEASGGDHARKAEPHAPADALPTETVGLAAWDLAASGLMWIHSIPPRSSDASQGAGSTFARHLGRRTSPQVQSNDSQLL